MIDTDCDPDLVDLPIPGNDDGIRSIELIVKQLADAIAASKTTAAMQNKDAKPPVTVVAEAEAKAEADE